MNSSKNKLNSEIIIILIAIQTHTQATRHIVKWAFASSTSIKLPEIDLDFPTLF